MNASKTAEAGDWLVRPSMYTPSLLQCSSDRQAQGKEAIALIVATVKVRVGRRCQTVRQAV